MVFPSEFFFMRYFIFILFLSISTSFSAQAKIKFEENSFKFPKTKEGVQLKHDYIFTNAGDQPLIISDIKVACTCTKFDFPKKPVMPNDTGVIHVTFDTHNKIAWQNRTLEVYSNAKNNPAVIRFKVMVDNK